MTRRLRWGAWVLLVLASDASAAPYDDLLRTIETDPSYKVRMQAIRVLGRRLDARDDAPPEAALDALGRAANLDADQLVRGLAVVILGQLGDPRSRPYLEAAKLDDTAFVRERAIAALGRLKPPDPPPPPPVAAIRPAPPAIPTLVVRTKLTPGVTLVPDLQHTFDRLLGAGFEVGAGGTFRITDGARGSGYQVEGTVAEASWAPDGSQMRGTVVIKVAITTLPAQNLRHVVSARASARTSSSSASMRARLMKKLIKAAVDRAVAESMREIGKP